MIVINLSELEPHINGPFTPDAATPISEFAAKVKQYGWPRKMEVGLIGSCTNSSYQDLSRAASIARQAAEDKIPVEAPLIINPGSEQIRYTAERDGILGDFERIGATIMANACGRVSGNGNGIPTIIRAKIPSSPPLTVISPNGRTAIRTHMLLSPPRNSRWR